MDTALFVLPGRQEATDHRTAPAARVAAESQRGAIIGGPLLIVGPYTSIWHRPCLGIDHVHLLVDAYLSSSIITKAGPVLRFISEPFSQDGATIRFAETRVTLRRDESSGAEPHAKGNGRSCLKYALSDWMSMPKRLQLQ